MSGERMPSQWRPAKLHAVELAVTQEYGDCSIQAAELAAEVHAQFESEPTIPVRKLYFPQDGPSAQQVKFVGLSGMHTTKSGRDVQFGLVKDTGYEAVPYLVAVSRWDVAVRLGSFARRYGEGCDHVQFGNDMTQSVVTPTDEAERFAQIQAVRRLVKGVDGSMIGHFDTIQKAFEPQMEEVSLYDFDSKPPNILTPEGLQRRVQKIRSIKPEPVAVGKTKVFICKSRTPPVSWSDNEMSYKYSYQDLTKKRLGRHELERPDEEKVPKKITLTPDETLRFALYESFCLILDGEKAAITEVTVNSTQSKIAQRSLKNIKNIKQAYLDFFEQPTYDKAWLDTLPRCSDPIVFNFVVRAIAEKLGHTPDNNFLLQKSAEHKAVCTPVEEILSIEDELSRHIGEYEPQNEYVGKSLCMLAANGPWISMKKPLQQGKKMADFDHWLHIENDDPIVSATYYIRPSSMPDRQPVIAHHLFFDRTKPTTFNTNHTDEYAYILGFFREYFGV